MSLQCPACNNALSVMDVSDIVVDVCIGGCGGIWFDNFELSKVDEQHEHVGEALLDIERNPHIRLNNQEKRPCPRCPDVKMMRRFFSVARKTEIDECPSCGGIWLDAGELRAIRNEFPDEKSRKEAFDRHFQEMFGDKLDAEKQKSQETLEKARKAVNVVRFICPSYWFPEK